MLPIRADTSAAEKYETTEPTGTSSLSVSIRPLASTAEPAGVTTFGVILKSTDKGIVLMGGHPPVQLKFLLYRNSPAGATR